MRTRRSILIPQRAMESRTYFEKNGYWLEKGLYNLQEVVDFRDHFTALNQKGFGSNEIDRTSSDPLAKFPRILMPHRWDEKSLNWLLDDRIKNVFKRILSEIPFAVQTMFYFKPPGARGQALHQDNFYLLAKPGTCVAAWLAIDDCDLENGCMEVVPGSQDLPILCNIEADTSLSFTDVTVPIPPGLKPFPVQMKAGDVLFFNGSLIHGSGPNQSIDRFRRALIGHYVTQEAQEVSQFYHPCLNFDGKEVVLGVSPGGGECGTYVDGELVIQGSRVLGFVNH